MISPSLEEFREHARDFRVIPVWRELVADLTTPIAAFARVVGDEPGFLLESVDKGERWSRYSFFGRNPLATLTSHGNDVTIDGELLVDIPTDQGMLAALDVVLAELTSPVIDVLPPFHSGLMGYMGYDIVREVERLPNVPEDQLGLPDAILSLVGQVAAFDHWRQRVYLIENVVLPADATAAVIDAAYETALERLGDFASAGANPADEPLFDPPVVGALPEVTSTMGGEAYRSAVDAAKEYILSGDIFQVVLAQRFDFELDAEPLDVYRVLRQINPSPYMYFVRFPELTLVGASPEPMVQLLDGTVISRPIAGTRRRGETETEDRRLGAELAEDPKERAEHTMLVDLARNDIGRVIDYGSMHIDELMTLEHYSHVMHLTSQVSGKLRDGKSPVDVLRATLPAGTVSGAPKVRAMEIIDEFEPSKRGPYAGVVGYLDFSGNIDTAIAIRTMIIQGNRASVQAGAGIVYDSVPAHEDEECGHKARALLAAIEPARAMGRQRAGHDQATQDET